MEFQLFESFQFYLEFKSWRFFFFAMQYNTIIEPTIVRLKWDFGSVLEKLSSATFNEK